MDPTTPVDPAVKAAADTANKEALDSRSKLSTASALFDRSSRAAITAENDATAAEKDRDSARTHLANANAGWRGKRQKAQDVSKAAGLPDPFPGRIIRKAKPNQPEQPTQANGQGAPKPGLAANDDSATNSQPNQPAPNSSGRSPKPGTDASTGKTACINIHPQPKSCQADTSSTKSATHPEQVRAAAPAR